MSDRPDKCRWCGCAKIISDGFPEIDGGREVLFACGSVWYETAMGWTRDPKRCGGQAGMLYKRIAKAIEVAQLQARWPSGEFGEIVEAKSLDLVIAILENKQ